MRRRLWKCREERVEQSVEMTLEYEWVAVEMTLCEQPVRTLRVSDTARSHPLENSALRYEFSHSSTARRLLLSKLKTERT